MLRSALRRLVAAMPKAELHLHLDGSLRPETALWLARTRGIEAPRSYEAIFRTLRAPPRAGSQAALLRAFTLPVQLLQDREALQRATEELVMTKAADGVRYLEVRWAPLLHTRRGLRPAEVIDAVAGAANEAASRVGIVVRLIVTALRTSDPADNEALARTATRFRQRGVVGFDLAGPEAAAPDPLVHRRAFQVARGAGLHLTVHAGEWGGAAQVWRALGLGPQRIAHGAPAIQDPVLVTELRRLGIALDLCPTSNVQAGVVASLATHPLARLHRLGVPVTLSSDDLTVSDVTLSEEYLRAVERIGLTLPELWAINRRALDVAFAEPDVLDPLRVEFDRWAAEIPELATTPP